MLSVNQQTIAGAQQSVAKPSLFSNPKTGSISYPKTGRAARGLLRSLRDIGSNFIAQVVDHWMLDFR